MAAVTAPLGAQGLSYSDDFESYGTPDDPPGWFDSAPGNPTQEAPGLYQTATDPADAANVAFGKQSASNSFTHLRTHSFPATAELELTGQFRRSKDSALFGVTLFSSFPTPQSYLRFGQSSSGCNVRLEAVGLGALSGDFDSGVRVERNRWYRFRILSEPAGAGLRVRARVWAADGAEPSYWQIDAGLAAQPAGSWIGLWGSGAGQKLWDDLAATSTVSAPPSVRWFEEGIALVGGATFARSITPTVEATGEPPLDVEATLDGEPWDLGSEVSTNGTHLLFASVTDARGATATATVAVTLAIPECTLAATRFTEDAAFDALLAARDGAYRANAEIRVGGVATWELDLRPAPAAPVDPSSTAQFDPWPNGDAVEFRMIYDGGDALRVSLAGGDLAAAVTPPAGTALVGDFDDFLLRAAALASGASARFEELALNGRPIGESLAAPLATGGDLDLLLLSGCELGGGFSLTGRIR
ncbi:MAG: hypothetical protein K8H90_05905, partial [Thermoanaerobaculia bacterium]|nr:hypothetical protein [Thermoanaerobaculia bacterium]